MSPFDLAVIAAIAVAGILGLWLGVVRVLLGIGSWIGAAVLTVYGLPLLRPTARDWIESPFLAELAAGGSIFLVGLVLFTILTHMIAERVRGTALGAVDRSVGLVAGLALGIVITSGGFMVAERLLDIPARDSERPEWLRGSRTAPLLGWTAYSLLALLPEEWRRASGTEGLAPAVPTDAGEDAKRLMTPVPEKPERQDKPGYNKDERREMDRLFNSSQ